MRICFWSTSFQADNQAMASFWAERAGHEVVVAMDDPDAYRREPVWSMLPFAGRLLDRNAGTTRRELERCAPDLLVIDNHLPGYRIAPRVLVLWHGFGWRVDDISAMRKGLGKLVGAVEVPNAAFRWQAFGDWDRNYRISHSGIASDNVIALGSAYSDLLLPSAHLSVDRELLQRHYTIDIVRRKTVLIALTWHHGGALAHWGNEPELIGRLVDHLGDANVLYRLHDRHRYERPYLRSLEALVARHPNVQLKFKSESPDSLVDLAVSDVMVSNYSSILNAYYYTRKPSVHIVPDGDHFRKMGLLGVRKVRVQDAAESWKLPPDESGGLVARSFQELCAAVDRGLTEPTCCEERSREFCQRYITGADGTTRERIARYVDTWFA